MAKLADNFGKFFHEADKDKDGSLSVKEMIKAMRNAGFEGTNKEITERFLKLDCSCDGKVTFEEYLGSLGKQPEAVLKRAMLRYTFCSYDKDESGFLEMSDVEALLHEMGLELTGEDISQVLNLMDTSRDGRVNYEEFLNYYTKNL